MENRNSLMCSVFGHRFVDIKHEKKEPLDAEKILNILRAIKLGTSECNTEKRLQCGMSLHKTETTHIKTYCKRCGLVV